MLLAFLIVPVLLWNLVFLIAFILAAKSSSAAWHMFIIIFLVEVVFLLMMNNALVWQSLLCLGVAAYGSGIWQTNNPEDNDNTPPIDWHLPTRGEIIGSIAIFAIAASTNFYQTSNAFGAFLTGCSLLCYFSLASKMRYAWGLFFAFGLALLGICQFYQTPSIPIFQAWGLPLSDVWVSPEFRLIIFAVCLLSAQDERRNTSQ